MEIPNVRGCSFKLAGIDRLISYDQAYHHRKIRSLSYHFDFGLLFQEQNLPQDPEMPTEPLSPEFVFTNLPISEEDGTRAPQ